eukprot:5799828-Pyramimonas_sp.AAC.1
MSKPAASVAAAPSWPTAANAPSHAAAMSGPIGSARPSGSRRCRVLARRQLSLWCPRTGGNSRATPATALFTSNKEPPFSHRLSMKADTPASTWAG